MGNEPMDVMGGTCAEVRERLIALVKARSVRTDREFRLASGKTSRFYVNLKPTMLSAEGAALIARLVLEAIADDDAAFVGGLEMGAVPLAAAVAAASHASSRPVDAFFVRKRPKEHGTRSLIEGLPDGAALAGRRVVILEDVTTTGGSALRAVEIVREAGGEVVRVITVVDREEGAREAFAGAGIPFTSLLGARDLL